MNKLEHQKKSEVELQNYSETIQRLISDLLIVFPDLSKEFMGVLFKRFKANNFTDKQIVSSVSNVIDTCKYKPTIGSFISSKDVDAGGFNKDGVNPKTGERKNVVL